MHYPSTSTMSVQEPPGPALFYESHILPVIMFCYLSGHIFLHPYAVHAPLPVIIFSRRCCAFGPVAAMLSGFPLSLVLTIGSMFASIGYQHYLFARYLYIGVTPARAQQQSSQLRKYTLSELKFREQHGDGPIRQEGPLFSVLDNNVLSAILGKLDVCSIIQAERTCKAIKPAAIGAWVDMDLRAGRMGHIQAGGKNARERTVRSTVKYRHHVASLEAALVDNMTCTDFQRNGGPIFGDFANIDRYDFFVRLSQSDGHSNTLLAHGFLVPNGILSFARERSSTSFQLDEGSLGGWPATIFSWCQENARDHDRIGAIFDPFVQAFGTLEAVVVAIDRRTLHSSVVFKRDIDYQHGDSNGERVEIYLGFMHFLTDDDDRQNVLTSAAEEVVYNSWLRHLCLEFTNDSLAINISQSGS